MTSIFAQTECSFMYSNSIWLQAKQPTELICGQPFPWLMLLACLYLWSAIWCVEEGEQHRLLMQGVLYVVVIILNKGQRL